MAEHFDVHMSDLFLGGCVALGIDVGSDPLIHAVTWALERRPDFYELVPGTQLRRVLVPPMPSLPRYRIWFRFPVDGAVVLEHIEEIDKWQDEPDYYG